MNFFYALFRSFKTLDVTDTGFHFTKAWGLFHGSVSENIDFLVGTNFFNGLWLSAAGAPSVLWARLGYVLVVTGISLISFRIYSLYFHGLIAWLIFVILSIFFIHYNYYLSINYDNLPVLSALAGIWLLLGNRKSSFVYLFSGIFLCLTVWLKFNFILILTLPFVYAWVLYEKKQAWAQPFLFLCGGYWVCFALGTLLLYSSGNLSTYINYLDENFIHRETPTSIPGIDYLSLAKQGTLSDSLSSTESNDPFYYLDSSQKSTSERMDSLYSAAGRDSHGLLNLFRGYFHSSWVVLQKSAVLSVLILILLLMLGESISVKQMIVNMICAFSIHYAIFLGFDGPYFIYMTVLIMPGYFFYIYSLRYAGNLVVPSVLILLVTLFSFPGSDLSFNVIYRSGAGLLFFAFPLAFMLGKKIYIGRQGLNMTHYVIIVVVMIMFSIVHPWGYNASHRDLGDRSVLVEMFRSPQLFGIHTFPQRVKVIDEALEFFNHETYPRNNTPALFLSWIPMMYYLTQTNCIMNNPWHGCVLFDAFKKEFDKAAKTKPPVYITFSKIMTRNTGWPLYDKEYRKQDKAWIPDLKKFDYIRYWMKDKNYSKVFENDMFEVYKQD
ncbi:hypothetical protein [uncultured Desulfobacter sp.]|uniref:hypothetical protein n=1 Tax=uncultured Desulfobacter sp. TaxID=240139 RepID=UPI002AAA7044|nr:hypothetical protein [uncultured Desulfobacter sp.]